MSDQRALNALSIYLKQNPELKISIADEEILKKHVQYLELGKNEILVRPGDTCHNLPIVLKGKVKVSKASDNAREVVLYYISSGESCILTVLGIMNFTSYPAIAYCEEPTDILLVSASIIRDFVNRYKGWRDFIFKLYNNRFHMLLEFINEIMFSKLDVRLIKYLLSLSDRNSGINKTHQQISDDLGTSREVISRILKDFEEDGFIELKRGKIHIINKEALKNRIDL